jgi:hypothetical protein
VFGDLPESAAPPAPVQELPAAFVSRTIEVELLVNKVGVRMLASHVDIQPSSICCVLGKDLLSLSLPLTDDVELTVRGQLYKVGYLGAWHSIPQLGITVVVFPRSPEDTA